MSVQAATRVLNSGRVLDMKSATWEKLGPDIVLMWYDSAFAGKARITTLRKEDLESNALALAPVLKGLAWMKYTDYGEWSNTPFSADEMSGLKEAGWWLCFPNAISETCLAAFKAVVAGSNMQVVMEDLLEGKGDVVVQDLRQFAEWFHLEALTSAIPKGGSSGKKQKTSHEASYSAHGEFDDGGKRVEDKGKEPLSEEEEKELSQSIQSELISLDDGIPSYRLNVMSSTPLGNAVLTFKEAGIDVRWRDFEDFAKWCGRLGVDLDKTPTPYGRIPAGAETAHYAKMKPHLEKQAQRFGRVLHVNIVTSRDGSHLLYTAVRTKTYLTCIVGYTDLLFSSRDEARDSTQAMQVSSVTREVKTEKSGEIEDRVAAQTSMQYIAFCPIADGLPLATGGHPNGPQIVAMVEKRGPTCGSNYQYCLNLFRGIPAAWVMAFEAEWADRARRYSDGDEHAFPQELIDGYKHLKSVVRAVPRAKFSAVYNKVKSEMPPEVLDSEEGADFIWDGLFD